VGSSLWNRTPEAVQFDDYMTTVINNHLSSTQPLVIHTTTVILSEAVLQA